MEDTLLVKFHNLDGMKIGEKKKSLNQFIRNIPLQEVDLFLAKLEPKTYLETLFKVDLLIHFRKCVELLELLKDGNEVIVSKIIKEQWFFHRVFNIIDEKQFVNEFLPQLSFCTRNKILKNICLVLTESQIDNIFEQVAESYGLHNAMLIISKCSKTKIQQILSDSNVRLSTSQLKQIFCKDSDFMTLYLINYKKKYNASEFYNKDFMKYLSRSDTERFWKICEECNWEVKLGRRTTKRELPRKKTDLMQHPKRYLPYFRKDRLVREMHKNNFNEFVKLYEKLFPKEIDNVKSIFTEPILKHIPKRKQFLLFSNTHQKVLGVPVSGNVKAIDEGMLTLIDDESTREQLAQVRYEDKCEEFYLIFGKTEAAIKLIKKKINLTSVIHVRESLLADLMRAASLDKSLLMFEHTLEYFCKRHNIKDSGNARNAVLDSIYYHFKKYMNRFTEKHWQYISEILNSRLLHEEHGTLPSDELNAKYLAFLYKSGKPIKENLKVNLKWRANGRFYNNIFLGIGKVNNPEFEKEMFMLIMEFLPKVLDKEKDLPRWRYLFNHLVNCVHAHNKKNRRHTIAIRECSALTGILSDMIATSIANPVDNSKIFGLDFLKSSICKNNRNDFENRMVQYFYSDIQHSNGTIMILNWFIKNDPQKFQKHLGTILKHADLYSDINWHIIKQLSHTNLDEDVVNLCLKQIRDGEYKNNIAIPLAIIMPTEDYIKLLQKYMPSCFVMKMNEQEDVHITKLRNDLASNLRKTSKKERALNILMKFLVGDYFQHVLAALHSFFHKVPEHQLYSVIDELFKRPESAPKKQCVYLSVRVLKLEKTLWLFNNVRDIQPMHRHMFQSLLKLCERNSSDVIFDMLIAYMHKLQKADTESLSLIQKAYINLSKYKLKFVMEAWKYFERIRGKDEVSMTKFDKAQFQFLMSVQHNRDFIGILPTAFLKSLLNKYFCDGYNYQHVNQAIMPLAYKFMLLDDQNFDFMFAKISLMWELKKNHYNNSIRLKKYFYLFFNYLKSNIKHLDKCDKLTFLKKYKTKWEAIFSPVDMFKEYVLLNLRVAYFQSEVPILTNFANEVVKLTKHVMSEFGELIYSTYFEIFEAEIKDLIGINKLFVLLCDIMENEASTLISILVIDLLSSVNYCGINKDSQDIYLEIKKVLRSSKDQKVILKYNTFICTREM